MRTYLITAITISMSLGVFAALPAVGQEAKERQVDQQAYQNLKLASGKRIDPVLEKAVEAYKKNFASKEAAFVADREKTMQVVKDNPNFTKAQKAAKLTEMQELYRKRSWELVRKYREPVNARLMELANQGLSSQQKWARGCT